MNRMMLYILALIVAVVMAVILKFIFAIPIWVTITIFVIVFAIRAVYNLYMTYKSKDLARLSRFLEKSSNTLNYYFFTQKSGSFEEQTKALGDVLATYSSQIVQGQYKAHQMILKKNYQQAVSHAKSIPNTAMRDETLGFVEAVLGKRSAAEQLARGKASYKHFILAIVAYRAKDMDAFNQHKTKCLNNCAGVQYFSYTYILERINEYVK